MKRRRRYAENLGGRRAPTKSGESVVLANVMANRPPAEVELARVIAWFESVKGRHVDDFLREALVHVCEHAIDVAVQDGVVLARLSDLGPARNGVALIRVRDMNPGKIVCFDIVDESATSRMSFWFNAHSVASLGVKLRSLPRRPFSDLFAEAVL